MTTVMDLGESVVVIIDGNTWEIPYDSELAGADGARFTLRPLPHVPHSVITAAKRCLHWDRDVVGTINVVRQPAPLKHMPATPMTQDEMQKQCQYVSDVSNAVVARGMALKHHNGHAVTYSITPLGQTVFKAL
jgi:hypothetical protein